MTFFGVILKLAHYSLQTILSQKYFFSIVNFFGVKNSKSKSWLIICFLDNFDPKIIFRIFSRFLSFFGVILKLAHYSDISDPKIIFRFIFSIFCPFFV